MKIPKREFTAEFREQAVKRVKGGQGVGAVARELGISDQTLRNWVNDYRKAHAGDEPPLTISERARLRELIGAARELP